MVTADQQSRKQARFISCPESKGNCLENDESCQESMLDLSTVQNQEKSVPKEGKSVQKPKANCLENDENCQESRLD